MAAYQYPLLDIFWTMLWFFLFFIWIWLLIVVFMDIFRSRDMGGLAKALWCIFIIVIPLLGVLIYLIARGGSMHERNLEAAKAQQQAFNDAVRDAAGSGTTADDLAKLADLRDRGVISQAEFDAQKAKILAS
jgi:hypothetical protein